MPLRRHGRGVSCLATIERRPVLDVLAAHRAMVHPPWRTIPRTKCICASPFEILRGRRPWRSCASGTRRLPRGRRPALASRPSGAAIDDMFAIVPIGDKQNRNAFEEDLESFGILKWILFLLIQYNTIQYNTIQLKKLSKFSQLSRQFKPLESLHTPEVFTGTPLQSLRRGVEAACYGSSAFCWSQNRSGKSGKIFELVC